MSEIRCRRGPVAAAPLAPGPYSESRRVRLWRSARAFALVAAATALALGAAGCSTSYQLGGMFSKADEKGERTGTVASPAAMAQAPAGAFPSADLTYAKAAAVELLARGPRDASQPWENPRSGARGTVTAIAAAYTQDGAKCRDFLASYVRGATESWYQGNACRKGATWEFRDIRPLQRS
jgi:surface antigen